MAECQVWPKCCRWFGHFVHGALRYFITSNGMNVREVLGVLVKCYYVARRAEVWLKISHGFAILLECYYEAAHVARDYGTFRTDTY